MAGSSTGGHQQVEDGFTCEAVLRAPLLDLQPTLQRVFGVTMAFDPPQDGRVRVRLRGRSRETGAAKLFVEGVVRREAQEELEFPPALNAVFCGGFFTDCLIRNTSAHVLVGSSTSLLIHGLRGPVAEACSLILDLLERYRTSQSQCGPRDAETLDSRLAFRALVEHLDQHFTLDLLVLPGPVKELLLDLAARAGLQHKASGERRTRENLTENLNPPGQWEPGSNMASNGNGGSPQGKDQSRIYDGEPEGPVGGSFMSPGPPGERRTQEELPPARTERDRGHLLRFFTTMGFEEAVVCGVLDRTGAREPSQVLDLIQQEQAGAGGKTRGEASVAGGEDFVLGVFKRAAARCGYGEEQAGEVYTHLPRLSPHQMILELQEAAGARAGPKGRELQRGSGGTLEPEPGQRPGELEGVSLGSGIPGALSDLGPSVRGPPQTLIPLDRTGPRAKPSLGPPCGPPQIPVPPNPTGPRTKLGPGPPYGPPQTPVHPDQARPRPPRTAVSPGPGPGPLCGPPRTPVLPDRAGPSAVITGQRRLLEALERKFTLLLTDDPGDPGLRQIIIDGSNVAMTHGLGVFFSCRGIALAVQFFWTRGHRRITVLVPQWRQKRDPRVKEPTFMNQLQDLGLLSFTPSREFQGQRINSYDDRFMLQLARSTDGIIVTNDNMRDLVEESPVWSEIIKTRLLQYVFAGDLFMVPDDPLGRSGPHINLFLQSHNSNSITGVSPSPAPPLSHPRAQAVSLQDSDRTQHQGGSAGHRTVQESLRVERDLLEIFPGQEGVIRATLQRHPALTDTNQLSYHILEHASTQEESS